MTIGATVDTIVAGRTLARVAVETDASADQFLSGLAFENLQRIANPASSARMLQAGRIDAWVQSATAAQEIWGELGLEPELNAGKPIYSVPVYVTAGLDYPPDIAQAYRVAIQSLVADGSVVRIMENYQ